MTEPATTPDAVPAPTTAILVEQSLEKVTALQTAAGIDDAADRTLRSVATASAASRYRPGPAFGVVLVVLADQCDVYQQLRRSECEHFSIEFNECGNLVSHTAEFGDIEHPEYVRRFWVQVQAIGPGLWAYSVGTEPVIDDFGYPEDGRVWAFGMDCRSDADATPEQVAQDIVRGLE